MELEPAWRVVHGFDSSGVRKLGWRVARFEFPYMQRQRLLGKKRPPDRAEKLIEHFREQVSALSVSSSLFVGGKSMGGRIASLLAASLFDEDQIKACLCLGYPFHPLGRPDNLRIEHLQKITAPVLIVQGERMPWGAEMRWNLSPGTSG